MNQPDPRERPRLVGVLVRYRFFLLPAAILLFAVGWPLAQRLKFDQSIESLYAGDDPHLTDYQDSKRLFGGDEFAIVAYSDPELIANSGVISDQAAKRVRELTNRLNRVRGINSKSTQDLASLTVRTGEVVDRKADEFTRQAEKPGVGLLRSISLKTKAIGLRVFKPKAVRDVYDQVQGLLISEDTQTTAVVLRLLPEDESPVPRGETIAEIRRIASDFGKEHSVETYVVGEPVQIHDMFRYVEEDGRKLFYWSLAALGVVILILFRSARWVALPLLVVVVTITWTQALLVISGMKLSMVSSMMNSLVTIIGVATVTHITVHYKQERKDHDREEALRRTLSALLPAVLWTCVTTAVGFAALISSAIAPVRSFGMMLALATLIVLFAVAAILPGGILFGRFDADPRTAPAEDHLARLLAGSASMVQRHPMWVVGTMFTLFAVAAFGLTRLDVETDFSKNFRESSPIVRSLDFVETRMGGAGTWEVNFPAPKQLDEKYIAKVRRLADRLRSRFVRGGNGEVTKVIAVTDGLDAIPRGVVPSLAGRMEMVTELQPEFLPSLHHPQAGRMRIVLRARERQQSATKLELIHRVRSEAQHWADDELKQDFPNAKVKATGLYVLLAFLIDNLLKDQLVSFALAATGIFLIVAVAFRSVLLGLLLLIPNTFPIVLVIGTIGWYGLPLNIATAMIASVSMGLTIDFNVHYLVGYRRARAAGLSEGESLRETLQRVGRALVFSNLALIVGFSVLTVSQFIPLIYFGILVSFAMLGGLMSDLLLMPLILHWCNWPSESMLLREQSDEVQPVQPLTAPVAARDAD